MSEYFLENGEWMDLRHAVSIRDITWIESILHSVEMRNYRLKMAQAEQIVEFKYLK